MSNEPSEQVALSNVAAQDAPAEEPQAPQKFMYQFVNHQTGERSDTLVGDFDQVAFDCQSDSSIYHDDDYLLVICAVSPFRPSQQPLITRKTYTDWIKFQRESKENQA